MQPRTRSGGMARGYKSNVQCAMRNEQCVIPSGWGPAGEGSRNLVRRHCEATSVRACGAAVSAREIPRPSRRPPRLGMTLTCTARVPACLSKRRIGRPEGGRGRPRYTMIHHESLEPPPPLSPPPLEKSDDEELLSLLDHEELESLLDHDELEESFQELEESFDDQPPLE